MWKDKERQRARGESVLRAQHETVRRAQRADALNGKGMTYLAGDPFADIVGKHTDAGDAAYDKEGRKWST